IQHTSNVIEFPERAVKLVRANREQLVLLSRYSDHIAEFRLAKESAHFWTEMPPIEQADWVNDLLGRIETNNDSNVSVCILDTGINNGHALLAPVLDNADCQTAESDWKTHDHNGHGTRMAGISAYGELETHLDSSGTINLMHRLESVKILPPPSVKILPPPPNTDLPKLWGAITSQAISLAEVQAPDKKRIICMAVASSDSRDRGRPSSWSATIDNLTSGVNGDTQKLMIISAGNSNKSDRFVSANYPASLMTDSIHDPAQSWNAVTIGAFTTLQTITDPALVGCNPLAPHNGLSPFTTTSLVWEDKNWPIKPEIVMEGGNLADNSINALDCENLSMLTTNFEPHLGNFRHFNMTSLATAQASWFAAQIQVEYPEFWPETIRALMIHSARWTEELISQFSIDINKKSDVKKLLRICGYGVPSLARALHSASNSLTLIVEEKIQPFIKEGSAYKTKDMHFYELPWPKKVLQSLPPEVDVEMRVTLSYFIEPGPCELGGKDKYRYASHMLRFELNSPGETEDELIQRINIDARDDANTHPG
ncbi:MAG: S8 family peptidase, partial [Sulfurovum sp.]|nr:S8 family peptidase [Sulfurovum sp.]